MLGVFVRAAGAAEGLVPDVALVQVLLREFGDLLLQVDVVDY